MGVTFRKGRQALGGCKTPFFGFTPVCLVVMLDLYCFAVSKYFGVCKCRVGVVQREEECINLLREVVSNVGEGGLSAP